MRKLLIVTLASIGLFSCSTEPEINLLSYVPSEASFVAKINVDGIIKSSIDDFLEHGNDLKMSSTEGIGALLVFEQAGIDYKDELVIFPSGTGVSILAKIKNIDRLEKFLVKESVKSEFSKAGITINKCDIQRRIFDSNLFDVQWDSKVFKLTIKRSPDQNESSKVAKYQPIHEADSIINASNYHISLWTGFIPSELKLGSLEEIIPAGLLSSVVSQSFNTFNFNDNKIDLTSSHKVKERTAELFGDNPGEFNISKWDAQEIGINNGVQISIDPKNVGYLLSYYMDDPLSYNSDFDLLFANESLNSIFTGKLISSNEGIKKGFRSEAEPSLDPETGEYNVTFINKPYEEEMHIFAVQLKPGNNFNEKFQTVAQFLPTVDGITNFKSQLYIAANEKVLFVGTTPFAQERIKELLKLPIEFSNSPLQYVKTSKNEEDTLQEVNIYCQDFREENVTIKTEITYHKEISSLIYSLNQLNSYFNK